VLRSKNTVITVVVFFAMAVSSGESVLDIDWEVEREVEKIIMCESGGRHDVWGDLDKPHRAYGIAQFQRRTFNYLKKLARKPELEWKNKDDQLWLLRWAVKNNMSHHWTCASKG